MAISTAIPVKPFTNVGVISVHQLYINTGTNDKEISVKIAQLSGSELDSWMVVGSFTGRSYLDN